MLPENESCFTCLKLKGLEFIPGGYVYEDELVFSSHSWSSSDQETPYLGGFIVEPKRHIPTWAELNDKEAETLGRVIRDVSKALKKGMNAEHIYVFVLGHHVPHLHVWIVPRYPGTPREFWGLKVFEWPDRPVGGQKEIEELCESIRSRM
jgi:diadenosine tetraphosphate (Ap4A) HIT family hydrolase